MILEILFWASIALLFHSYVLFPFILRMLAVKKTGNMICYGNEQEYLPRVSVIMSVYNEEAVIIKKIRSIFDTGYPLDKIELIIGSDGSDDRTGRIIELYARKNGSIRYFLYESRRGKGSVINDLAEKATGAILILTDAKAIFTEGTIYRLVRHFKNNDTGIVGANIKSTRESISGISIQERSFMSREIRLKEMEGRIWGATVGVYGACYAIRKELYSPVPDNFSVDDFYMTMHVICRGKQAIMETGAVCYEEVPDDIRSEFHRKVRISAGNFQNMARFGNCLWPPFGGVAFSFLSHKVIRWLGPFIILLILLLNIFLLGQGRFYQVSFFVQLFIMFLPLADLFMRKIGIHVIILRFITHFYYMNLALLKGFIKYARKEKTHVWQPTRRQER